MLIANETLNPVAVYECAVRNATGSRYIAGALAFESSWRCVYYDPNAANLLSWAGPSRAKSAPRSLRSALLIPKVNTGSFYRCGKRT